eukprot:scaffold116_cov334-Pavlova_lutheri.AAC.37
MHHPEDPSRTHRRARQGVRFQAPATLRACCSVRKLGRSVPGLPPCASVTVFPGDSTQGLLGGEVQNSSCRLAQGSCVRVLRLVPFSRRTPPSSVSGRSTSDLDDATACGRSRVLVHHRLQEVHFLLDVTIRERHIVRQWMIVDDVLGGYHDLLCRSTLTKRCQTDLPAPASLPDPDERGTCARRRRHPLRFHVDSIGTVVIDIGTQ